MIFLYGDINVCYTKIYIIKEILLKLSGCFQDYIFSSPLLQGFPIYSSSLPLVLCLSLNLLTFFPGCLPVDNTSFRVMQRNGQGSAHGMVVDRMSAGWGALTTVGTTINILLHNEGIMDS